MIRVPSYLCLKKWAIRASRHWRSMSLTQSRSMGLRLVFAACSQPVMIHWMEPSKYGRKLIGPSSGSAEMNRNCAGIFFRISTRFSELASPHVVTGASLKISLPSFLCHSFTHAYTLAMHFRCSLSDIVTYNVYN